MSQEKKKAESPLLETQTPQVPVSAPLDLESWFEKNKQVVYATLIGVLVGVGAWFGYGYWSSEQEAEAQRELFNAQAAFEADSTNRALKGVTGSFKGFEAISEDYSGTKAGKLAHFYIGVIKLKEGKFDDAISHLEEFNSDDILLQARAYSLIGDAYLEQNKLGEAISAYKKAANHEPNKFFSPTYLLKLALAQELNKDTAGAIESYNTIITKYYDSGEAAEARRNKARLEAGA